MKKAARNKVIVLLLLLLFSLALEVTSNSWLVMASPPPEPEATARTRDTSQTGSGNLAYNGGQVLSSNQTYLIFWLPSGFTVSSKYQSLITRFMGDVATDSGKTSNVYYSTGQYTDSTGNHANYQSSFGGVAVDNAPFPQNGCNVAGFSVCFTDAQIQSKISSVMLAKGWTAGANKLFFLLTPKNVASCFDGTGSFCSFVQYCGYHHYYTNVTDVIYYSHIPYAMTSQTKCGSNSHPNNDDADSTINIISHEHGEMLTDPQRASWRDALGKERGDKCAWQFGQVLGWTLYGKYNQIINGSKYYLQSQWSNTSQSCVLNGS